MTVPTSGCWPARLKYGCCRTVTPDDVSNSLRSVALSNAANSEFARAWSSHGRSLGTGRQSYGCGDAVGSEILLALHAARMPVARALEINCFRDIERGCCGKGGLLLRFSARTRMTTFCVVNN